MIIALALTGLAPAHGQARQSVNSTLNYHRLLCVVPIIGAGTKADPRRPKHIPSVPGRDGIVSWNAIYSDDGSAAIVELVAVNRSALADVLTDPSVISFERGAVARQVIESTLKRWRKDFNLDTFRTVAP